MSYQVNLPSVFPYCITTDIPTVRYMTKQIISKAREDALSGSSFAITTDAPDGMWRLWMSETTKDYIVSLFSHIEKFVVTSNEQLI